MNKERLLKLAKHLERGQLGHKNFSFAHYNISASGGYDESGCGTMGCAIGECPIIFPKFWHFNEMTEPLLRTDDGNDPIRSAMEFFDISRNEAFHLFMPSSQSPHYYGGQYLNGRATKEEVAANIRAFIKVKQQYERL